MDNHFTFDARWLYSGYQLVSFGRLPGSLLTGTPPPSFPARRPPASNFLFFIFRLRKYDVSGSDRHSAQLHLSRPHFLAFWISTNLSAACRQRSCSQDSTLQHPLRSTQACLSSSKYFSLPFLPWLGYRPLRPLRPALETQRHRSRHLVKQDTLPLLCQWPGLRRWSRPRRRRRKRQQNPPKRIKSRAAKDGR